MNSKDLDKEALDKIHILIHSLRLIDKYKASNAEKKINDIIIARYSATCEECKQRGEQLKLAPPQKEGFLDKIGGVLNG